LGGAAVKETEAQQAMKRKKTAYVDDLRQLLRDPAYAAEYLNAVLEDQEDGADAVFLLALRNVAEAFQMGSVAQEAGVNRENLYRMLSGIGNPRLSSLLAVLRALGLRLSVESNKAGKPERYKDRVRVLA
jgi:probable addiction module antidote protein